MQNFFISLHRILCVIQQWHSRDQVLSETDNGHSEGFDVHVRHEKIEQNAAAHLKAQTACLREAPEESEKMLRVRTTLGGQFGEIGSLPEKEAGAALED